MYTLSSKNRQGGLSFLNLQDKVVRQYENTTGSGDILDKYLQVIPPETIDKDIFYLTPLPKIPLDPTKPWFKTVPVGKNRLNTMLKEKCAEAGITANYINHSLRAYGKKLIKQQTGHRSLESLRQYQRTSESQLLDVSNIVSCDNDPSDHQMVSVTKSQQSAVSDVIQYKDPSPHDMFSVQSTSLASLHSSRKEPPRPTFIFNSCNFSSCSMMVSRNDQNPYLTENHEMDDLLKGITVEDLFT